MRATNVRGRHPSGERPGLGPTLPPVAEGEEQLEEDDEDHEGEDTGEDVFGDRVAIDQVGQPLADEPALGAVAPRRRGELVHGRNPARLSPRWR